MKQVLLVIDMQEVCVGKNHSDYFHYDNETLIRSANEVIDRYEKDSVVYIRNVMKRNLLNKLAPFQAYEDTGEIELVSGLHVVSDHVFDKYVGDAFSNDELIHFLKEQNADCVEVIGVDGAGCVALTAAGAIRHGYQVIVNTKAIGTISEKKAASCFKKLQKQGAKIE